MWVLQNVAHKIDCKKRVTLSRLNDWLAYANSVVSLEDRVLIKHYKVKKKNIHESFTIGYIACIYKR